MNGIFPDRSFSRTGELEGIGHLTEQRMYPSLTKIVLAIECAIFLTALGHLVYADDGHELWLRYKLVSDKEILKEYRDEIN